jgi:hypothetical protein
MEAINGWYFALTSLGSELATELGYLTNVLQSDILEKYDLDFQILFVSKHLFKHIFPCLSSQQFSNSRQENSFL